MEMELQVELIEKENIHYFKIAGEIDAFTAPILKEKLASVKSVKGIQAELDLLNVAYIDSTGLGVFIGFYKSVIENEGHLKITGANARIKKLFKITGLDEIIDVERKEGESRDATV